MRCENSSGKQRRSYDQSTCVQKPSEQVRAYSDDTGYSSDEINSYRYREPPDNLGDFMRAKKFKRGGVFTDSEGCGPLIQEKGIKVKIIPERFWREAYKWARTERDPVMRNAARRCLSIQRRRHNNQQLDDVFILRVFRLTLRRSLKVFESLRRFRTFFHSIRLGCVPTPTGGTMGLWGVAL